MGGRGHADRRQAQEVQAERIRRRQKGQGIPEIHCDCCEQVRQPLDLGLTYITVQSSNKESEQIFDTDNDLDSTPDTKVLKGRESEFDVGFGVADPNDVVMEVALQDDFERPNLLYSS
jgi:hypothetical protein